MTRALDGSYWRVRSNDATIGVYPTIELAYPMASQLSAEYPNVSLVRIRPRMSIVRAVRLLTEARKQGVELWMRSAPETWGWLSHDDRGWIHMLSDGRVVEFNLRPCLTLKKWIVATPEDARKIDARGKK